MTRIFGHGHNRILESLPQVDLALLTAQLKNTVIAQGAVLQEAGESIEHVYFPHSGMISMLAVMSDGAGVETATIGAEGCVNAMAGLGARLSPARAVMQVEGEVAQIPAARFRAVVESSPALRDLVVRYNDVQMALVQQTAGCNALHLIDERLCRWLLQTHDRCEGEAVPLTQEFLAEMLGVQRTSVTATARKLQDEGLIRYSRGNIDILDRAGLERRACECYATLRRRTDEFFS